MWIGILGPLEVRDSRGLPVEVGGARLRALLARLALGGGRTVSAEALIDDLWGARPPNGALNALQQLVSRLRRALPAAGAAAALRSEPSGYRLDLAADDVDALRFEQLAAAGRRALAADEHATAAELLRDAEQLWRGPALAGLGDLPFAPPAAARLADLRLLATEARIDAELALGRHDAIVAEVERLAADHPLRERLQGQVMKALYATGRQSEALAAYERVRGALADQLGADPSAELAGVHLAILRQAPELTPERPDAAGAPAAEMGERAAGAAPSAPLTRFVGREEELSYLGKLLDESRLVTTVGPGGAGKSRLATELLARLPAPARDAAWFVELAPVTSPTDLLQAVMSTLGVREHALVDAGPGDTRDPFTRLAEALGHRQALLVLDNCEHLVDAAALLAERLLAASPNLRILTTSREPLGIAGEKEYPIPPLGLPPMDATAADALGYPAVQLFADRAAGVRPDFAVTDGNAASVVEICRRLDGLPLAIELAAARLRILSPAQIASRLDDRFQLLTGGSRIARPHHQTLRAVVDWSWDLLSEPERVLARRFSVFVGGATLEAAEAVCSGADLPPSQVLDALGGLVEKSLLEAAEGGMPEASSLVAGGMRYRMLETIRAYGAERLADADETRTLHAAHAQYYLGLAEAAEPRLRTRGQLEALALLKAEHPNLLAALRWVLAAGDHEVAIRLCAALIWYWVLQGARYDGVPVRQVLALPGDDLPTERAVVATVHAMVTIVFAFGVNDDSGAQSVAKAREHVRHADLTRHPQLALLEAIAAVSDQGMERIWRELDRVASAADPWTSAVGLLFRGFFHDNVGDPTGAWQDLSAARAAFGQLGDRWGLSLTAQGLAGVQSVSGDPAGAAATYREALAHVEELGAASDIPSVIAQIGYELIRAGDLEGARTELTRALALADRYGNQEAVAWTKGGFGNLARYSGDLAEARRWYEEALAAAQPGTSAEKLQGIIRSGVASVAVRQGEPDVARQHLRRAVEQATSMLDLLSLTIAVHALACLAVAGGEPERAAVLLGTSAGLRGNLDRHDPDVVRVEAAARERLGDAAYTEAYERGASLSREDAVATIRAAAGVTD